MQVLNYAHLEWDKVFPTSRVDGKMFCWLFSGGLNVGKSPVEAALHGNTPERSVQTKQQMHGVKSLNFLKLNNGCKQSRQQTGAGLL